MLVAVISDTHLGAGPPALERREDSPDPTLATMTGRVRQSLARLRLPAACCGRFLLAYPTTKRAFCSSLP